MLDVDPDSTDVGRFERKAQVGLDAVAAGRPSMAASALHDALAEWRGPALLGVGESPVLAAEATRLELRRLQVLEQRLAADLALGRAASVVDELEALVAGNGLNERFWAQLMLALYRSGRQADALHAYQRARHELLEELGLDPGPELRELEAAILAQDPALALPADQRRVSRHDASPGPGHHTDRAGGREGPDRRTARRPPRPPRQLTGFGGVGKTHLALDSARRHAVKGGVDVGFVDASELVDPAQVLVAIAEALDVTFTERREFLSSVALSLDDRRTVLVIDNLEHVLSRVA